MSDEADNVPKPGTLLIAPPMMRDPNFGRTVVLLCEHTGDGSFGLILNRPVEVNLSEVMGGVLDWSERVGIGGPVQTDTLHFIHRVEDLNEAAQVTESVYWGGDFDDLRSRSSAGDLNPQDVRFFIGYAGWGAGQLQDEIDAEGWILSRSANDLVFDEDPSHLWRVSLKRMGGDYAMLANFPVDPRMN